MSVIDTAITRLAELALASGAQANPIKFAPVTPVEDNSVLPMVITHFLSGQFTMDNANTVRYQPVIAVDFHFSRLNLGRAYTDIDAVAVTFATLLGGDPTLSGAVDTINFPVNFSVSPAQWDKVVTQMLRFEIPLKTLENPSTT